jgi:tRNA1(Val) A37 N6-methylase TrmN6
MTDRTRHTRGAHQGDATTGDARLNPAQPSAVVVAAPAGQGSVWVTGQVCSREQRRTRYRPASMAHPGKMLPSIARYLIATYTRPGDIVLDPMAGIATTLVEAMHLGRHGVGVEYEARWADLAAANLHHASTQGAPGSGQMYTGDSRQLPALLPTALHGRIALVITSPPYGPSTHGHVRTPGPRRGKVRKVHHRYGNDRGNLAHQTHDDLAAGFTTILTGCAALLSPGGHVAVTARPYRRHGELVDIPGMVEAAGANAGLRLIDRCAALIAGVRDGRLIPRASFFQMRNIRAAHADADPQWLLQHEDVLLFDRSPQAGPVGVRPPPFGDAGQHRQTGHGGDGR